jgi:hypothetical protein
MLKLFITFATTALLASAALAEMPHSSTHDVSPDVRRAPALAQNGAYCLRGGEWGFPGNCQFATFQQCRTSASGIGGTCGRNPTSYYPEDY